MAGRNTKIGESVTKEWIGTTVGLLAGIAGTFITDVLGDWSEGESVLFGLVTFLAGVAWDTKTIASSRARARDRTARLMESLEESDLDTHALVVLNASAGKIRKGGLPDVVKESANRQVEELSFRLRELADDKRLRVETEEELQEHINNLTRLAKSQLYATSAVDGVDARLWTNTEGEDYRRLQARRRQEGVEIRRIFFTRRGKWEPQVIEEMLLQESPEFGFKIGALEVTKRGGIEDFIIFDGKAVVLTTLESDGSEVAGGLIMFDQEEIDRYLKRYNLRWDGAIDTWSRIRRDYQGSVQQGS
jgi:hypothetical protein